MNILSVQSSVAFGTVGNAAAAFPLQRLGAQVWPVDTVRFSNHPAYGDWTGRVASGEEVTELLRGIERRGAFARCDAVLSGYLGDVGPAEALLAAIPLVRAANPGALYCCDPVIGDGGRVYVRPGLPELIGSRAVPLADLLTPNGFELQWLTGIDCSTADGVRRALAALRARMRPDGKRAVMVTSVVTAETGPGLLDVVAADEGGIQAVSVPLLQVAASGAGDVAAALFLHGVLRGEAAVPAMARAAAALHGVLRQTAEAGSRELLLVAAQQELVRPTWRFEPRVY